MAETESINNAEKTAERSSEEIRKDIFEKLESLSKTVDQIGSRMHETFDWREQVGRHPYIALGAAAGVGFLLSGLFKPSPSPGERMMDALGDAVENIGDSLHASLKEENLNKNAAPNLITVAASILLKVGIDYLLDRISKDKPPHNVQTNGERHASSKAAVQHPTQVEQARRAY